MWVDSEGCSVWCASPIAASEEGGTGRGGLLRGGCLCGEVRYEITGELGPIVLCHCSQCRRASGSAFASNASVDAGSFRILEGEGNLVEYESSTGKRRVFCRRCGSPLYVTHEALPDSVRVRLGSLDDDPGRRPSAHIWVGSKACWYEIADGLDRHAEMPPGALLAKGPS